MARFRPARPCGKAGSLAHDPEGGRPARVVDFLLTVRVGYRRSGVARALLEGLVEYAREQGAPALEAYPVETEGSRIHGSAAYVGVASMFETVGFSRVLETAARSDHRPRWLMRLSLSGE